MLNRRAETYLDKAEENSIVILLFCTLVIFSFFSTGTPLIFAVTGIILCAAGMVQGSVRTDMWILIPMTAGTVICGISAYRTYGSILEGYMTFFGLYPVIYMLYSYLDRRQSSLLRRLCVLWSEIIAAAGIAEFIYHGCTSVAYRLGGIIGNPNALGIFLAVSWMAVLRMRSEGVSRRGIAVYLEPLIPAALALTLSMGSFLALAAGFAVYALQEKKGRTVREAAGRILPVIAEMSLFTATGLLIYIAARKTDIPMIALAPAVYAVFLCIFRNGIRDFFAVHKLISAAASAAGAACGGILVLLRPSAPDTFAERLEMMKSGIRYFLQEPLTGIGTYQWRFMDLQDGGTYFNTWHIHCIPVHIAAELGIFALAALVIIFVRAWTKKENRDARPAFTAFILHNMIDTGFFYFADTTMLMLTSRKNGDTGKETGDAAARIYYGCWAAFFTFSLIHFAGTGGAL